MLGHAVTSPGPQARAQVSDAGDWLGSMTPRVWVGPGLARAPGCSRSLSFKRGGRSIGEPAGLLPPPAPPRLAPPAAARARPVRASLRGSPKGGGRGGGAGRSRARRSAVPGHRPPGYTQHVNRARREEPGDRREPALPAPPPAREPAEPRAARPGGGRQRGGGRAGGGSRRRAAEEAEGAAGAAGQDGFPAAG